LSSTSVENALQITPFYAKQSQFAGCSNERNFFYNKVLQKKRRFRSPKKQSQFKPNQTQSPSAIRNTQYEIRDTNPIKPNFKGKKNAAAYDY